MTEIIDELTAQGIRSVLGNRLSINSLRHILHNDRYLGTYRYADVVIEEGMPQLIDRETFDKVQRRFKGNKRMGPHTGQPRRGRRASLLAHRKALLRRV